MNKRLIIIGAGGHGEVVADNAVKNGYTEIYFLDDRLTGSCMGFDIVGKLCDIERFENQDTDFVAAIGDNKLRREISEAYNVNWATLIHPSAQIGLGVTVGDGTVVMANAVINSATVIGKHCIINSGAVVEHDNIIEDYVHISPKAALGGAVHIGALSHIGIGSAVKNNTDICSGCTVGAGAAVVKNIENPGRYIGVPARKM